MISKKHFIVLMSLIVMAAAGFSHAALLGNQPGFPIIVFDSQGTLTYDAATDLFSVDASPLVIRISPTTFPRFILPASGIKAVTIRGYVDETGTVIDGIAGNDLEVIGAIDKDGDGTVDVEGLLITGEITQMGFLDSGGPTDIHDLRFIITGGALINDPELAISFLAKDLAIILQSENSDFTGDFSVNFTGGAKGTVGPIDAACTMTAAVEACVILPPPPPVVENDCKGKLTQLVREYTGEGCEGTSHSQDAKKVNCIGNADGAEDVYVKVTNKKGKRIYASKSNVNIGDTILVEASHGKGRDKEDKKKHLDSATKISVYEKKSGKKNEVMESVIFHTSCSQPLNVGDQFGSFKVVSLVSTKGGLVDLPDEPTPEPDEPECITELPAVAPPHCLGKIGTMGLRYTGGGCSSSSHSQGDSASCIGDANSASPVRMVVSDSTDSTIYLDTGTATVELGDVIDAEAVNAGLSVLKNETKVKIYDVNDNLIESIILHTSCSKPVDIGNRFGSVEIYSLNTTEGSAAGAYPVEYTYTVTNGSILYPLQNVTVIDDVFGEVPGSPISVVGPGETATLTLTVLLDEETTTTASIVGYVGGIVECNSIASATITEEVPPIPQKECTEGIKALLLKYTGPEILDATVVFSAKFFDGNPVIYSGVDLVDGVVLTSPMEDGWTINGAGHSKRWLGPKVTISINGISEEIHTSCSVPLAAGLPAPLNNPSGDPSPNWEVVDFEQK